MKKLFNFKPKIGKKHFVLIVSLLVLLSSLIFFVPKAINLYQSHNLEKQGDLLLASNEYEKALDKYQLSKIEFERVGVNKKIEEVKELVESEFKFQEGKKAFEEESWEEAIKKLSLVSTKHKDYEQARSLIETSNTKINSDKYKTASDTNQTETKTSKPTASPIIATATLSPTNTPAPQTETELVVIGNKQYQCQKDKTNEIRQAKINRDEALQKVWDCTDKCFDDRFACEDDCLEAYKQNWNNEALESCYAGCRAVSCNDVCYLYTTQAGDYEGILTNLLNNYCH